MATADQFAQAQPNDPLPEGGAILSAGGQNIINNQLSQATTDNTGDLMQGVGMAANGLLKDTPTDMSLGRVGLNQEGFNSVLQQRNQNSVAGTANSIQKSLEMSDPLRRAAYENTAAQSLAKSEQIRYNNWTLNNQQLLAKAQLAQAQSAAETNFLSQILGFAGAAVGAGIGGLVGGPAGAAAGAAAGSKI